MIEFYPIFCCARAHFVFYPGLQNLATTVYTIESLSQSSQLCSDLPRSLQPCEGGLNECNPRPHILKLRSEKGYGEWKFTGEKCATTATSNPSASGTREGIQQVSICGGPNEAPRDVVKTREAVVSQARQAKKPSNKFQSHRVERWRS